MAEEPQELQESPLADLTEKHSQWKIWAMACGLAVALFVVCLGAALSVTAAYEDPNAEVSAGASEGIEPGGSETGAVEEEPASVGAVGGAVTDSEQAAAEADAQAAGASHAETPAQTNAFMSAKLHMSEMPYSHAGIVAMLESEGYSHEDAVYAADRLGVDWNAKAAEMAQQYVNTMEFTREDLIDQLMYEGFTREQATAGVTAIGL